jgi:hypothetical protein
MRSGNDGIFRLDVRGALRWAVLAVLVAMSPVTLPAQEEAVRSGPSPVSGEETGYLKLLSYDNGDVSQWAECFVFDSPSHPKLVQLRKDYALDDIVKGAKTDLERALALKDWVAKTLKFGKPGEEVFSDWSAIALLNRVKRKETVWCGQCAMVFQQACMAIGMPARFIELGVPDNPACHFTTEVYLREYGKWAVIDPTALPSCNAYYTVEGVPQSALEMHQRVVRGEMDKVTEVHPDRTGPVELDHPGWSFYYVRWVLRCDVVTRTPVFVDMEHVFDRWGGSVEWTDDQTVPWEKSDKTSWWTRNIRLAAWNTSDPAVVNWHPTNRVRIVLRPESQQGAYADLWSADPGIDHFRVSVDSRRWRDTPKITPEFTSQANWSTRRCGLKMRPGRHEIKARVVYADGSLGPESFVIFSVERRQ